MRVVHLLVLALFVTGCSVNPVTGKRQLNFYSEQEEIAMGAEADLREAVALEPELGPAWRSLADLLAASGRADEASDAAARARDALCTSPRRHPHGLGTGEVLEWGIGRRWLLLREDGALGVALPSFYREACERTTAEAS